MTKNDQFGNFGVTDTDFSEALQALKKGKRIARAGWNGKGMFVYLNMGSAPGHIKGLRVNGVPTSLFEAGDKDTIIRMPNFNMKAADGSTVTGWVPSQVDAFAEDWQILPD